MLRRTVSEHIGYDPGSSHSGTDIRKPSPFASRTTLFSNIVELDDDGCLPVIRRQLTA